VRFVVERQSLEVLLSKVHAAWKDAASDSIQSRILVSVEVREMTITASNGVLTQAATAPLFEKADGKAEFLISGPDLNDVVKSTQESGLKFDYEKGVLEIEAGRSHWRLVEDQRNMKNYNVGKLIVGPGEEPKEAPDRIKHDDLIRAMKIVENGFDPNTEIKSMRGIHFTPTWIGASTGTVTIVQRWKNMFSKDFWLRGSEFKALKEMLTLYGEEHIEVHYLTGAGGATRIQFDMGTDRLVCNAMEFTSKDVHDYEKGIMTKTKQYDVVFEVDKRALLEAIKMANVFSEAECKLQFYKDEKGLLSLSSENEKGNQAHSALPVTFRIPDETEFDTTLNWKTAKDSISALTTEIVKFGRGQQGTHGFIRLDEGDMSIVAFERKASKKKVAAKKKDAEEKEKEAVPA